MARVSGLVAELKRRNVIRVGVAYVVTAWLIIQVVETIFPVYRLSDASIRVVITLLAIGFFPAVVLAWVYEITPEGLKLEKNVNRNQSITPRTGKALDRVIIGVLVVALSYFAVDKFVLDPARDAELVEETTKQARSDALTESYGDKSIAVLPFVNMSDDESNEYFSDGVSEELLNLLAKIPELRVVARTSSFYFKDKDVPIGEIGVRLGVSHVLEGSVRKSGSKVRITAQLVEARSDTHLWSETYERELTDIFDIQDDIAGSISDALKYELLSSSSTPRSKRGNVEAYDLFLAGQHHLRLRTPASLPRAIQLFEQSIEIDPNHAPAWSGLADAYGLIGQYTDFDSSVGHRRSLEAAQKAVELDPLLGQAYASLGRATADVEKARQYLTKATELNPGYSMAHMWLGTLLNSEGRLTEGYASHKRAAESDPLHPSIANNLGVSLMYRGLYGQAEAHLLRAFKLNPENNILLSTLSQNSWQQGKLIDAYRWSLRAYEAMPASPQRTADRVYVELLLGRAESSTYWLNRLKNKFDMPRSVLTAVARDLNRAGRYEDLFHFTQDWVDQGLPRKTIAQLIQGRAMILSGNPQEAITHLNSIQWRVSPVLKVQVNGYLAFASHLIGNPDEVERFAKLGLEVLDQARKSGYGQNWIPFDEAMMMALLGSKDEALNGLDEAYEAGWRYYYDLSWIPFLDQLLFDEPRYVAFTSAVLRDIERMRLVVEQEAAQQ